MSRPAGIKCSQYPRLSTPTASSSASSSQHRCLGNESGLVSFIGRQSACHTMSSTAVPPPKSTGSERLALTAFLTRSSHTPSQFHSPGRRFLPRAPSSDDFPATLAVDSEVGELGDDRSCCVCRNGARYDRHAWYAPGFAAASAGTESSAASSLKVERIYSNTLRIVISLAAAAVLLTSVGRLSPSLDPACLGVLLRTGLATPDPLTLREVAADLRARPNHCGNPWRRLNPPGGSRSSSVALTVSVSEEPVVYVYVVRGVSSGWKTSVEKVTRGGSVGYVAGNDIWKRKTAGAYGPVGM